MRKTLIAGNWKMNKSPSEGVEFVKELKNRNLNTDVEVLICPPFTHLALFSELLKDTDIKLGAQNFYYKDSGTFTGEISPKMLKDLDIDYIIIGHSERREIFLEDDELVNKKMKSAIKHGLKPILCVGESLEEREANKAEEKIKEQIELAIKDIDEADLKDLVIAYEPIWAIGTGKTASSDDANEMLIFIRKLLAEKYSDELAKKIRLQYGGSVNPENIKELINKSDVDGALVGGASLEVDSFEILINKGE